MGCLLGMNCICHPLNLPLKLISSSVVQSLLPLSPPLVQHLVRVHIELQMESFVQFIRATVRNGFTWVSVFTNDGGAKVRIRIKQIWKGLPLAKPPVDHEARPGKDHTKKRVAAPDCSCGHNVAIHVCLSTLCDVEETLCPTHTNRGNHSREHMAKPLVTQIIVARELLMSAAQLKKRYKAKVN